jgi:hypothetical protein
LIVTLTGVALLALPADVFPEATAFALAFVPACAVEVAAPVEGVVAATTACCCGDAVAMA